MTTDVKAWEKKGWFPGPRKCSHSNYRVYDDQGLVELTRLSRERGSFREDYPISIPRTCPTENAVKNQPHINRMRLTIRDASTALHCIFSTFCLPVALADFNPAASLNTHCGKQFFLPSGSVNPIKPSARQFHAPIPMEDLTRYRSRP